jgi:predicted nucleic acid-binding protein
MDIELLRDIPENGTVTVDTAPIIYFLQDNEEFAPRFADIFAAAEQGLINIVISVITLAEVLTGPLQAKNEVLARSYRETLCNSEGWRVVPVDEELAVLAARMRSTYKLRLPDAIQVATAVASGSHALLTHDQRLAKIKDVSVIGI